MSAAISIVPSPPAEGLRERDDLATARECFARLTKGHEGLHKSKSAFVTGARRHGNTFIQSSCTVTTAAALGAVDGRFGGHEGRVQWGVSLDAAVAVAGHVGGLALSLADDKADSNFDVLAGAFHSVGDTGLASAVYRYFHQLGVAAAQRAAAGTASRSNLPAVGACQSTACS
jgi:hypothetical protein